jgi:hypothetical protein
MSEFEEYQRRRFMRENAHRYIRHDAWRFMPPGSPIYVGMDVLKYFWPQAGRERAAEQASGSADSMLEAELLEYRRDLAKLRLDWELLEFAKARKYNPNQPRVAAGNPDGGQWTSGEGGSHPAADRNRQNPPQENELVGDHKIVHDRSGEETWKSIASQYRSDGSLARQTILNRDGSFIVSEFSADPHADGWDERHKVRLPDGSVTTFQNSGETQTVFDSEGQRLSGHAWTVDGPESQAIVQPAFLAPAPTAAKAFEAGIALYSWWASRNTSDAQAVFSFRADEFASGADRERPAIWVGTLTKEQVSQSCPRYSDVQSIANQAAESTDRGAYDSRASYGTAVHKKIEEEINGPTTYPKRPPRDLNFRAEASLIKSRDAGYGLLGSRRVDVLENTSSGTVCVYDIKTGKSGLSFPRALELASTVSYYYPGTQRIIVTEVRPGG